jgi:hypothetical protein
MRLNIEAESVLLQVAATTRKTPNSRIPNYPSLSSQLLCQVHNITLHVSVNKIQFERLDGLLCIPRLMIESLFSLHRLTRRLMRFMHR